MLREKPANEYALNNLIDFLNDMWLGCQNNLKNDVQNSIKHFKVAKRTFYDIVKLGIVKVDPNDKDRQIWLKEEPTRRTALQILDYRLKKTKKTLHVPIPDFSGIADTLQTIGERLAQLTVQNEKWLRTNKTTQITNEPADLFRVDDQRLYIAGQIASGVYSQIDYTDAIDQFEERNDKIIKASDDLMNKLLKKDVNG